MLRLVSVMLLSTQHTQYFIFWLLSMQERAQIRFAESIVINPKDLSRRVPSVRSALDCHRVTALQTTSRLLFAFVITAVWVFLCVFRCRSPGDMLLRVDHNSR